MISKLSIRNYKSNRRLDIILDPHVTTIVGESYQGKSNVIRGFKWVALNRPAGTHFIRWGSRQCLIRVDVDKHKIVRRRTKKDNVYLVDGHPLRAFGNDVPVSVGKILNLSTLNFQTQQEIPHGEGPLFWFALSPGQVSKRLNRIVNLEVIDRTLSNLQSASRQAHTSLEVCRERKDEAEKKAETLSFVDRMDRDWQEVRKVINKSEALQSLIDSLEEVLQEAIKQKTLIKASRFHLGESDGELREIEVLRKEIIRLDKEHDELLLLMGEIGRLEQNMENELIYLAEDEKKYKALMKGRCPLCGRK
jgi:DNA repair ATPase RecN